MGRVRAPAAILLVALLLGCGPTAASQRPTATPGPTPSEPTLGFATLAWEPVELPIELAETRLVGVSGGPAGGVVFAWHGAEDGREVSALVPGRDGWGRAALAPRLVGTDALVALTGGYLAFVGPGEEEPSTTVWASRDGVAWSQASTLPGAIHVDAVSGTGSVAVACGGADGALVCLQSDDGGQSWVDADLETMAQAVTGLVPLGAGFLAVGVDAEGRPRAYRSGDGTTWDAMPVDVSLADAGFGWGTALARRGPVAVLAGTEPAGRRTPNETRPVVLTTLDGRSWRRVPLPATDAHAVQLVDLGGVLVGAGLRREFQSIRLEAILTSTDGTTWRLDAAPAELVDRDAALAGAGLLLAVPVGERPTTPLMARAESASEAGVPAAPLPSPVPPPSDPPDPLFWGIIDSFPGDVAAVAEHDGRFVAVGHTWDDRQTAATWLSADGLHWTPNPEPEQPDDAAMESVARWSGGFVAAGQVLDEPTGERTAAFWRSSDGVTWRRAPWLPEHALGAQTIDGWTVGVRGLVEGPSGLVAVATTSDGGVTFVSTDGETWRRGAVLGLNPNGIAVTADGVIAVGSTSGEDHSGRAVVWSSTDGRSWADRRLDGAGLTAIAANGEIAVAVGPGPAAWTSTRGGPLRWAPDQRTLTWGAMRAVAVGPSGITAVGRDRCEPGIDCLVAWRSRDGLAWSRARLHDALPDDEVVAVVARDEGAIVIGRSQSREGIGTVVWVGAPLAVTLDR